MQAELWGLFVASFLASTLLPGGSEAVLLALAVADAASPALLLAVATAGNTLGGMSSWVIGWWLRRRFPERPLQHPRAERAQRWLGRWGGPTLLFAWLPVIGDPLCLAAGWLGVRPLPAGVYIAIGKAARYAVLLAGVEGLR